MDCFGREGRKTDVECAVALGLVILFVTEWNKLCILHRFGPLGLFSLSGNRKAGGWKRLDYVLPSFPIHLGEMERVNCLD